MGNIKAHLARATSRSEHRIRFIFATCGTSHVLIVFLVRKQIGFSVGQSELCNDLSCTNNTNWRVGRNCVKTANECTYTVCSAGCSVNKKSQRWIPNCEMSSSINQTRGYPLNPAFAKLCSPLEHRALYALRTFFFYFMRNAGAVKFVLHSYHKPRLPEILDNASLRISRKRKPQQQY